MCSQRESACKHDLNCRFLFYEQGFSSSTSPRIWIQSSTRNIKWNSCFYEQAKGRFFTKIIWMSLLNPFLSNFEHLLPIRNLRSSLWNSMDMKVDSRSSLKRGIYMYGSNSIKKSACIWHLFGSGGVTFKHDQTTILFEKFLVAWKLS